MKRTGWVNNNVQDPETVSGHMYRMAMMALLFEGSDTSGDENFKREKLDTHTHTHTHTHTFTSTIIYVYTCSEREREGGGEEGRGRKMRKGSIEF